LEMIILVFEPDLIFSSKFDGISRLIGMDFSTFTDPGEFLNVARAKKPDGMIINLDAAKSEMLENAVKVGPPVLGYYSHVNSDTALAAKRLGVGQVVTREAFLTNSGSLVDRLLKSKRQAL
jgi:hypothetical protein